MSTSTHERQYIQGGRIEVTGLTKRFGSVLAVDDLTFAVEPGRMTGFLGPNGAGKTTTLRMLLGLIRPTSGSSTIGGRPYSQLDEPLRAVGAAWTGHRSIRGGPGAITCAGWPRQRASPQDAPTRCSP